MSAAKRISNYDIRSKIKNFITRGETNRERASKRAARNQEQPESKTVSAAGGPDIFIDSTTTKPDRIGLDSLIPFLEERIAFTMPSDIKYLDGVLDYINERMLRLGILKQDESELLIALDEGIVNAIKHGNKCDPQKAVRIVAEFSPDCVRFTIADEGPGFDIDKVPDPTAPCRLLEPNGRGLLLMNHIMDEVCYNQAGKRLEMFKRVDRVAHDLPATDDAPKKAHQD
ncbi:MAG TPA: ATP-binding protein [Blastocatellia bacterium]|nr:ATP-binding protein [Blastocatellia bacterium]